MTLFDVVVFFFIQAEGRIRDFCLCRGLGDVYRRQLCVCMCVFVCGVSNLTSSHNVLAGPSGAWHRLEHPSLDLFLILI